MAEEFDAVKVFKDIEQQRHRQRVKMFHSDMAPKLAANLNALLAEGNTDRETRFIACSNEIIAFLKGCGRFYKKRHGCFEDSMYFSDDYKILYDIHGDLFKAFLAQLTGVNRASHMWEFLYRAVEDASIGNGVLAIEPSAYWHVTEKATYITYKPGKMIRINAMGAQEVNNGTDNVVFPQSAYLENWELVEKPVDPFSRLQVFRGGTFEHSWGLPLLRLWTLSLFCLPSNANRPLLTLSGSPRSGKTAMANVIIKMLGVAQEAMGITRSEKSEEALWLRVDKGGVCIIDNIDDSIPWIANTLCCIASGDAMTRRTMYTDKGETTFKPNAHVILTTARPVFVSETSVADRLLVISLIHRNDGRTSWDTKLQAEAAKYHSGIMTWVVQQVTKFWSAPLVECDIVKRAPSFSAVAMTLAKTSNDDKRVEDILHQSEFFKRTFNLSNSRLGKILALMAERIWAVQPFEGDAQALLSTIQEYDKSFTRGSVQEFIEEMRRLAPNLAQHIQFSVNGTMNSPIYRICGMKATPTQYLDEAIPTFEEMEEQQQ